MSDLVLYFLLAAWTISTALAIVGMYARGYSSGFSAGKKAGRDDFLKNTQFSVGYQVDTLGEVGGLQIQRPRSIGIISEVENNETPTRF